MNNTNNNSEVINMDRPVAEKKDKISNASALMHMIKSTIGGGFLAMPEAFHNAGLLVGSIGTMILGVAVLNMMSFIVRISQKLRSGKYAAAILAEKNKNNDGTERKHDGEPIDINSSELVLEPMDYPDTVEAVFKYGSGGRFASWAPFAKKLTTVSLIVTYYGVNIIYVCIVASTTKQLVDIHTKDSEMGSLWYALHGLNVRWYPLFVALLIIPMGMIQLIRYLVPFSVIANGLISAGTVVLFYFIFTDDNGRNPLNAEERAKLVVWPMTRWTLFAGSALCSMEGVGMLMHIENSMKKPRELAGPPGYTLHWSMLIIVILNGALGFFGYIRYGERCLGSVPLNLPSDNSLSEGVKIAVTLGILMTYGLQLTVTADLVWQWLKRRSDTNVFPRTGSATQEVSEMNNQYKLMRFSLIIGTVIVATIVPDVGPMISLVGSVGFSVLGLLVPAALETVWYWDVRSEEDYSELDVDLEFDGIGLASAAALTSRDDNLKMRKIGARRTLRHIKNFIYVILALSALAGGAFYNLREMFALVPDHT
ncbi:proton-coupled amino acid transporter-like protein pathetic [Acyrthosiphon pisum]|uniref:Amino acid transporter transmembrane domain-containing protein n=1 Tax=Acyrthosiphon pisum TaxID=7029 RepID=A0A8R2JR76_ACYPI|nr:proton-coupled amino acid transporter-like protein pathetic [Acyrthosiphon pisum]|eukprot:XP_016660719.1 PREDICTED: proton-coupled amino acid transporter 1-like [Acyrthosiphon pisum]